MADDARQRQLQMKRKLEALRRERGLPAEARESTTTDEPLVSENTKETLKDAGDAAKVIGHGLLAGAKVVAAKSKEMADKAQAALKAKQAERERAAEVEAARQAVLERSRVEREERERAERERLQNEQEARERAHAEQERQEQEAQRLAAAATVEPVEAVVVVEAPIEQEADSEASWEEEEALARAAEADQAARYHDDAERVEEEPVVESLEELKPVAVETSGPVMAIEEPVVLEAVSAGVVAPADEAELPEPVAESFVLEDEEPVADPAPEVFQAPVEAAPRAVKAVAVQGAKRPMVMLAGAAGVLLLLGVSGWFFFHHKAPSAPVPVAVTQPVAPASTPAVAPPVPQAIAQPAPAVSSAPAPTAPVATTPAPAVETPKAPEAMAPAIEQVKEKPAVVKPEKPVAVAKPINKPKAKAPQVPKAKKETQWQDKAANDMDAWAKKAGIH